MPKEDIQSTADLLASSDLVAVVGMLQETDDEDIWVVPSFAQCRVREDESNRLFKTEQLLLLLQDLNRPGF